MPKVGMRFESLDAAKLYYKMYARQIGFQVRGRNSQRRGKSIDVTVCDLVCWRQGNPNKKKENPDNQVIKRNRRSQRCECKAKMRLTFEDDKSWLVRDFVDAHSHDPITPYKTVKFRTIKIMPKAACMLAEKFSEANIPVAKVPAILGGETIGLSKRDCYNHLNSKLKKYRTPEQGDVATAYDYFQKKSVEDPQFFYAIQRDTENRAVNFFWVDGRSCMQYQHFGDVVSFDTTYRVNAYKMPFGPFTGINHHYDSIQFGYALLLDETEESFLWLFETWLVAMGGHPPVAMLTDQDPAMTKVVRKVFPNTWHRFCYWHVTIKFPEHFGHIYKQNKEFAGVMNKCLRGTYSIDEFEMMWKEVLEKYGLMDNEWLKKLYDIREK